MYAAKKCLTQWRAVTGSLLLIFVAVLLAEKVSQSTTPQANKGFAPSLNNAIPSSQLPPSPTSPTEMLTAHNEDAVQGEEDKIAFITGLENLPPSFRGTRPDGEWQTDAQGNLLITPQVRDIFDYFLAGLGEETLGLLTSRIRAYISNTLQEPAKSQAYRVLNDYLAMQKSLARIPAPTEGIERDAASMGRYLQTISDTRRATLGPDVADAFFSEEEQFDRFSINRMEVIQNNNLSAEQKSERIQALTLELPEATQQMLRAGQTATDLNRATQQLRESGGNDADLYQLRRNLVGDEAAARLAQLDQQRSQWNKRMDDWLEERQLLLENSQLNAIEKKTMLENARINRFNAKEISRVVALEKIRDKRTF